MKSILRSSWLPAVAPYVVYVAMTEIEALLPRYFAALYCLNVLLTVAVIAAMRKTVERQGRFFGEAPTRTEIAAAVVIGAALGLTWIYIDQLTPHLSFLFGRRIGFDPIGGFTEPAARIVFLCVRFAGLAVVVPYIEELFFRGFLLRVVTEPNDWNSSSIGRFTWAALGVNVVLFSLTHPEWLAAALFAVVMCFLARQTRGLAAPMIAHAVANLVLGIMILHLAAWTYW